jgi:hypothetical protein
MTVLNKHSGHSLYNDYSIPLKNSLMEETDLKSSIQHKDCFRSNNTSRTSRKIQKLSPALRKLLGSPKVNINNNDVSIDDCDELRDSIHLTKQRIKSRQLGVCDIKESESYLCQKYLDIKVSTQIKNEFTKDAMSYARLLTGQSTFARITHSLRAKAA